MVIKLPYVATNDIHWIVDFFHSDFYAVKSMKQSEKN
jgi:hypothetical protein